MQESGLSLTIDPRWIVAVPQNDDIRAEVESQLGEPSDASDDDWREILDDVTHLLTRAIEAGAMWSAVFLAQENDGRYMVARAAAEVEVHEQEVDIETLFEEIVTTHQQDEYQATIARIETRLGPAVSHRQVVSLDEDTLGEYRGFHIASGFSTVRVQAFSSGIGWAEVWGASLESMVLTLRWAPDVPVGQIQMQAYVMANGPE